MRLIFWDLELEKQVDGDWDAAKRGEKGISVLCLYDSETSRYHFYDSKHLDEALDHLNEADVLIGFNTISFDTSVIQGVTNRFITTYQYDILSEIWDALPRRESGWKLNDVCLRTLGIGKSGNGEHATSLVADQEWGKLFTYCLGDVHLVIELFTHIQDGRPLITPTGEELHLEVPDFE